MDRRELLDAYRRMLLIRRMEERIAVLYRDGLIPGFVHTSVGQEACAVGALFHSRSDDIITSTHRGHGHTLAKGLEPRRMLAELMGKATGACRGRGGSMHVADPAMGIFGANGIVGAGMPIAVGAAQAIASRHEDRVVVAFFGDGAIATGAFHESINLAALQQLPLIFFCENNGYSEFSRAVDQHPVPIRKRADAYGVPFVSLDGNDVSVVAAGMLEVLEKVRSGGGPFLIEAATLRVRGHYEGDDQRYREPSELESPGARDPLEVTAAQLLQMGISEDQLAETGSEVDAVVADAEEFARSSPEPDPSTMTDFVYVSHRTCTEPPLADPVDEKPSSGSRILRKALEDALAEDPDVFLAGIDVANGNVFGITRGLSERFPDRVMNTPIAETAIMGLGIGAAMAGLRPVVELMYLDFLGVCFDQILNQAAKLRFMTGGAVKVPLVIRTQFGAGRSSGSQHSQSLEALLAHIPGLTVLMPGSGPDMYGLLRSAIEDDNPVVFIENRLLYEKKWPMPPSTYRVPIGKARVLRPGSQVTLVSWSRMALDALQAAEELALEGIDVEVIDLRTIVPLDRTTLLESIRRTGRLVIAHEAVGDFGVGGELVALAADEAFWSLDAPVGRVASAYAPAPYAPSLERRWKPGVAEIVEKVRQVAQC